jgi:hypothetical protein
MPNPRKAVQKNLTKLSKKQRKTASKPAVKMGSVSVKMPLDIKSDPIARHQWESIITAYKDSNFEMSSGDVSVVTKYCHLQSEIANLKQAAGESVNELYLTIHKILDGKRRMAIQLEDRLFLNPTARMRNFPQQPKKPEPTKEQIQFADVL